MSRLRIYTDEHRILRHREKQKEYRKSKKGKEERKKEKQSVWFKKSRLECTKRWRLKNPKKHKAQWKLNNAICQRKIKRSPCEICGNKKSHAHHPNYDKPLKVVWLCAKHHRLIHLIF